jgi:hypothetical protein
VVDGQGGHLTRPADQLGVVDDRRVVDDGADPSRPELDVDQVAVLAQRRRVERGAVAVHEGAPVPRRVDDLQRRVPEGAPEGIGEQLRGGGGRRQPGAELLDLGRPREPAAQHRRREGDGHPGEQHDLEPDHLRGRQTGGRTQERTERRREDGQDPVGVQR